jgi:type II secretory pathway pseudopilin PulG
VAASKPTSWLSVRSHLLCHLAMFRDLSCRSGLFPSRLRSLSLAVSLPRSTQWYSHFSRYWYGVTRPQSSRGLPPLLSTRRFPYRNFGENQISPSSFGFSPLPTGHPRAFQRSTVRTSTRYYPRFTLPMGSSLGFGSKVTDYTPYSDSLSLRLRV